MASAIGIDIGGTRLRAARVADGVIEARATAPSSPDPREVLVRVLDLVRQVHAPEVVALGIGVPGQVQAETRRVLSGGYVNLSAFETTFAEKRPFFAEGGDILGLVSGQDYIYSRRIGAPPRGPASGDFVDRPQNSTMRPPCWRAVSPAFPR